MQLWLAVALKTYCGLAQLAGRRIMANGVAINVANRLMKAASYKLGNAAKAWLANGVMAYAAAYG